MKLSADIILFMIRRLGLFLLAVLTTYVLATVASSLAVAASLRGMGVSVPANTAASMIGQDLFGMADMFLPMVAFGLLIAFMTAALIFRILARVRILLYLLAGATAMICMHVLLHLAFGITPVAAARSMPGLALQALAGAAGGVLYSVGLWKQSSYSSAVSLKDASTD